MEMSEATVDNRYVADRRTLSWRTVLYGFVRSRRREHRRAAESDVRFLDWHHPWLFFLAVGTMVLSMQETGNLQQFIDDVKSAVDGIVDFPDDAEEPVVEELGRTLAVVSVAISADLSRPELKTLAEYYRERLLALPEVPGRPNLATAAALLLPDVPNRGFCVFAKGIPVRINVGT